MAGTLLDHPADQPLDVERVLADQKLPYVLGDRRHPVAAVRFADPRDARVGVDAKEIPLEVPLDDTGLDVGDLDVALCCPISRVVRKVSHEAIYPVDRYGGQ